jgi:cystathionine beta-lyase
MQPDYDFNLSIDRRGTGCYKWRKTEHEDVIPFGVADMDFRAPPAVLRALHNRVDHGIFGYSVPTDSVVETVQKMLLDQYDWQVPADWLVWLPGLVPALNAACRSVCEPGEAALMTTPIYPPFLAAPKNMRRESITVPMRHEAGTWSLDLDRISSAITEETRLFMLCNPHNPVGRVYSEKELRELGELCLSHDLVICSDEIHCGLVLDSDRDHMPLAKLFPEAQDNIITLMSPSKTFNLAGIGVGFGIIPGDQLRRSFARATVGLVPSVSAFGYVACEAAYRYGEPWRQALLNYLRQNRDRVEETIEAIPGLSMSHVEGTYLAWIDAREMKLERPGEFFESAGVQLWDGADFAGEGFVRLNFGCPREQLKAGLERMRRACDNRAVPWR